MADNDKSRALVPFVHTGDLRKPSLYKIMLQNNGVEPTERQHYLLMDVFNLERDEAAYYAALAKKYGKQRVYTSTFDVVETKNMQANLRRVDFYRQDKSMGRIGFTVERAP